MTAPKHAVALRQPGETPWIGLPAHKNPGGETIAEMMKSARLLNWDVRKEELVTAHEPVGGADYEIIGNVGGSKKAVRLAMAGEKYTTVQNEALAEMAEVITDGEATLDVAGYYRGGRSVFMSFTLGENIVLDPNGQADEIGRHLTLVTSHDGTTGVCAFTGNLRLACQNMLTAAKASALSVFKMRHTAKVEGRIADARTALGIGFKQSDVFEKEMQTLIEAEMGKQAFWELVTDIFPEPEEDVKGSVKKWETKTDTLMSLWNGETTEGLDNNAYKAYNVLNEHLMWYGTIRDGNTENALLRASGFDNATNNRNVALYNRVLAAV